MRITGVIALACLAAAAQGVCAAAQPGSPPNDQAGTPLRAPPATDPSTGVTSTPQQGPPSAAASPAPADSNTVETIIVTANRRAENLQNVPVAVTAVTGAGLVNSGISNLQDLAAVVPGLTVQNGGFETNHLRGVGSSSLGPGIENSVALYVDGVYQASAGVSLIDFVDVAQVEVLKGPQGTLFGRNATGGLIQVTTKTPSHDFHLDTDVSYGNYQTGKADLYVTGGITQNLAADFALQASGQGEGYGFDHATGRDVYKNDSRVDARSKWVLDLTPDTKITAIFDYSQARVSTPGITLIPGTKVPFFVGPTYRYSNPWDTDTDSQPLSYSKGGGVSLKLEQDLGFARFTDIVAYRQAQFFTTFDIDGTATPFQRTYLLDRENTFTEEAQLQSQKGDRIQYTAGIFYFHNDGKYAPGTQIQFPGPAFDPVSPFDALGVVGEQLTTSVAGYAQASTEVLPATNLTVGARYTYERRTIAGSTTGIIPGDIPVATLASASNAKDFYRPTFRVALDHRFSPEVLGYVSFNTGFKSGGFNAQNVTDPAYNPETIYSYETGLKTDLLDRRLRLNGSFFFYNYDHVQVLQIEGAGTGVINGPNAKVYGTDFDAEARITHDLTLTGGFEYLHDRFTNRTPFVPTGAVGGGVTQVEASADGNRLPVTPDAVVDLRLDYRFDLFGGRANANATYQYNTGWDAEADNIIHQSPFSTLNASLRWKSPTEHYTVALYATNLTNTVVQGFASTLPTGEQAYSLAPPRLYGVTVGYHF